jgi:O-6-methylguanine DNA methyltransferase
MPSMCSATTRLKPPWPMASGRACAAVRCSARAVGRANGMNRLAIVIPCHRVIGADGSLTGYGGGLWRKRRLLDLEAAGA